MLRLRRYRIFAIIAVFTIIALYHFRSIGDLENAREELSNLAHKGKSEGRPSEYEPYKQGPPEEQSSENPKKPVASFENEGDRDERPREDENPEKEAATSLTEKASNTDPTRTKDVLLNTISSFSSVLEESTADFTSTWRPEETLLHPGRPVKEETTKVDGSTVIDTSPATDEEEQDIRNGPAAPVTGPGVSAAGSGRFEVIGDDTLPKIHWSALPEHFPLPSDSLIPIPTGKPKAMPKIQYQFKDESPTEKVDRVKKLGEIKDSFSFSWSGYRKNAWMQDELSPVSGQYRNPFCGWAATLVDSLDTLWIMGMKREFEEAVKAVKDIDFTTSIRNDIPLFETTIRYLGGFIGAYDISGGKYKVLIDKAVELAEILMGSFDTPNRMPMTFYLWKPAFASQPHRARTRVVLAEIGSLSVEFTRLAQITKEAKYYDAIARITNEFEEWQNYTRLPGLFPKNVDASGCKKPEVTYDIPTQVTLQTGTEQEKQVAAQDAVAKSRDAARKERNRTKFGGRPIPVENNSETATKNSKKKGDFPDRGKILKAVDLEDEKEEAVDVSARIPNAVGTDDLDNEGIITSKGAPKSNAAAAVVGLDDGEDAVRADRPRDINLEKRQFTNEEILTSSSEKTKPDCEAQGLASPPYTTYEEFTLGGMADSLYEYLPKQYMLLGGLEKNYQTMFEAAMDAAKKHLLYRPMIEDEKRDILFPGQMSVSGWHDTEADIKPQMNLMPEGSHLGCFVGGMFGVGAKIFDREEDLEVAKRLTDGCVWAYESTPTGIMPEGFEMIPCDNQTMCQFNQTRWYESLDPYKQSRISNTIAQDQQQTMLHDAQLEDSGPPGYKEAFGSTNKAASSASPDELETADLSPSAAEPTTAPSATDKSSAESISESPERAIAKRQLDEIEPTAPTKTTSRSSRTPKQDAAISEKSEDEMTATSVETEDSYVVTDSARNPAETSITPELPDVPQYTPPPIPTTEEVAKGRIRDEHLPPGMVRVKAPKYILRPEAIESVFIMYRITGDDYWRKKGWAMFEAIRRYTSAAFGASAISDVMSEVPVPLDEMESFWLAETLKYFYLLFSDPSFVSLDDYIL